MKQHFSKFLSVSATIVVAALILTACKKDEPVPTPTPTQKNIVEIVIADTSFSLLKQAVVKAGLVSDLSTGSLTVFAPDNDAFRLADIDSADIADEDSTELVKILKYHVLGAKVEAAGVPASDKVQTLSGLNLFASKNANGVFVNGIEVKRANIQASNGVIHVISDVLEPPTETIAELVSEDDGEFDLLLAAVVRAGLASNFVGSGKYTVFAPTDAAFEAASLTADSIARTDSLVLVNILLSHVIGTNVFASDLREGPIPFPTEQGVSLAVALSPDPSVKINGSSRTPSKITDANIVATNGVIHVIDRVLLN
jgi:uncharacterized surface protein with fasciclin (FAS1) repeats